MMLAPDDRTTLAEHIRPPSNAELTHLVGTTCALDLNSALIAPLAAAGNTDLHAADSVQIFAALHTTVDKIDIFHQAGRVAVPQKPSRLLTLLEGTLHAVHHRQGSLFGPKLWLARYACADGTTAYKLIVLTRDLTPDKSWDVAVVLDGYASTRPSSSNHLLSKLIEYLPAATVVPLTSARRKRITDLSAEIRYAHWTPPAGVTDVAFHALGIPGVTSRPDFSGNKQLIVSPDLDAAAVTALFRGGSDGCVVSTQQAFDNLGSSALPDGVAGYVLAPDAGIPTDMDTAARPAALRGLHANLVCAQRNHRSHLFIGSASPTGAAWGGNVEFLVELDAGKSASVDQMLGDKGMGPILVPLEPAASPRRARGNPAGDALDAHLRDVAGTQLTVDTNRHGEQRRMHVTSSHELPAADDVRLTLAPLTQPAMERDLDSDQPVDAEFDVEPTDATALFIIRATRSGRRPRSTVIRAQVGEHCPQRAHGPPTGVITSIEEFVRLLQLLLGPDDDTLADDLAEPHPATNRRDRHPDTARGLFEMLIRTAADRPEALDKACPIVEDIIAEDGPEHVLPVGFSELWSAVNGALRGAEPSDE
ncbi:hypothetical protein ABLE94_24425 [Gordonia sp. VNK1]|uniref:hypothetical protein n=1 Tax=Gordonia oleivorans TaxID=3156618 RepID=UPI0032B4572C